MLLATLQWGCLWVDPLLINITYSLVAAVCSGYGSGFTSSQDNHRGPPCDGIRCWIALHMRVAACLDLSMNHRHMQAHVLPLLLLLLVGMLPSLPFLPFACTARGALRRS